MCLRQARAPDWSVPGPKQHLQLSMLSGWAGQRVQSSQHAALALGWTKFKRHWLQGSLQPNFGALARQIRLQKHHIKHEH